MTLEVRVSGRTEKDVDTIFEWLAKRSKDGAVRWYHAYLISLHSLLIQAEGCGIAPEAEKLGIDLRQFLFKTRSGRVYRSLFVIVGNRFTWWAFVVPGKILLVPTTLNFPHNDETLTQPSI